MYHWAAFVTGLIVSDSHILYFVCFYYAVGFPGDSNKAGAVFSVMLMYDFIYTGTGQFVAAYGLIATFASLVNAVIIGTLVPFCGVSAPYAQIQAFWRYWMYWLNPFTTSWVQSSSSRLGIQISCAVNPSLPSSIRRLDKHAWRFLLHIWMGGRGANLTNPGATSGCRVCEYRTGADYLEGINLLDYYYGWRDAAICVIFALSSYAFVFVLMKLRTKASKKAE